MPQPMVSIHDPGSMLAKYLVREGVCIQVAHLSTTVLRLKGRLDSEWESKAMCWT